MIALAIELEALVHLVGLAATVGVSYGLLSRLVNR